MPDPASKVADETDPEDSDKRKEKTGASLLHNSAFRYGAASVFLVVGLTGTIVAGYRSAMAAQPVEKVVEEEDPEQEVADAMILAAMEEYRPVPGMDLAKGRSPETGNYGKVIDIAPAIAKAPAVTRMATSVHVAPDTAHELVRPLSVRNPGEARLEQSVEVASAGMTAEAGPVEAEALRKPRANARGMESGGALVPVPGISIPEVRSPEDEPLPGSTPSTILSPQEYNNPVTPR